MRVGLLAVGFVCLPLTAAAQPSAAELADAMGVIPGDIVSATIVGAPNQYAVFPGLGAFKPLQGTSIAYFSSGIAGAGTAARVDPLGLNTQPGEAVGLDCDVPVSPPLNMTPETVHDCLIYQLVLQPPPTAQGLEFGFNFASAEYPEYVNSEFNDEFRVRMLQPALGITHENIVLDYDDTPININNGFFSQHCSQLYNTGFDFYTENGLPGIDCDAGATAVLTTQAPVNPVDQVVLEFILFDRGDGVWDSGVMVDNLRWLDTPVAEVETGGAVRIFGSDPNASFLEGGQEVILRGVGLSNVSSVEFGLRFDELIAAVSFEEIDDTSLRVVAPPYTTPEMVNVVVTAQPATNTSTGAFIQGFQYRVRPQPPADEGCQCTLSQPGRGPNSGAWVLLGLLALALARTRRLR